MAIKTKRCNGCGEIKDVTLFAERQLHGTYSSQCRDCLNMKARERAKRRPYVKKRKVGQTDAGLANDLTKMRW